MKGIGSGIGGTGSGIRGTGGGILGTGSKIGGTGSGIRGTGGGGILGTGSKIGGTGSGIRGTGGGILGTGSKIGGTGSEIGGTGSGILGTGSKIGGTGSGIRGRGGGDFSYGKCRLQRLLTFPFHFCPILGDPGADSAGQIVTICPWVSEDAFVLELHSTLQNPLLRTDNVRGHQSRSFCQIELVFSIYLETAVKIESLLCIRLSWTSLSRVLGIHCCGLFGSVLARAAWQPPNLNH